MGVTQLPGTQIGPISLTTDVDGTLPVANGGTNITTYALGDILYCSATGVLSKLAGNTTTTKQKLVQTGNGSVSAAPVWENDTSGGLSQAQVLTIASFRM